MTRISYDDLFHELERVLLKLGFTSQRAAACAGIFADNSLDGVYSHGLNRFPVFVQMIEEGHVDIHAEPVLTDSLGALERWDGRQGPGNLNARTAMGRAIELAKEYGLGAVALRNTNHWMRAGTYGWQAAEAGCIGMCWTNTIPNLPPWGGKEPKLGNNPLVLAVPRPEGHVVLDIAMSQYSYGKLQTYRLNGEELPYEGGYDEEGRLSKDPAAIAQSKRPLPIGYWKGSGLSLMLDLLAMLLSGGKSTMDIGQGEREVAMSQVFVAFDYERLPDRSVLQDRVDAILDDLHQTLQAEGQNSSVRYPGESSRITRNLNREQGIPVEPTIWERVQRM